MKSKILKNLTLAALLTLGLNLQGNAAKLVKTIRENVSIIKSTYSTKPGVIIKEVFKTKDKFYFQTKGYYENHEKKKLKKKMFGIKACREENDCVLFVTNLSKDEIASPLKKSTYEIINMNLYEKDNQLYLIYLDGIKINNIISLGTTPILNEFKKENLGLLALEIGKTNKISCEGQAEYDIVACTPRKSDCIVQRGKYLNRCLSKYPNPSKEEFMNCYNESMDVDACIYIYPDNSVDGTCMEIKSDPDCVYYASTLRILRDEYTDEHGRVQPAEAENIHLFKCLAKKPKNCKSKNVFSEEDIITPLPNTKLELIINNNIYNLSTNEKGYLILGLSCNRESDYIVKIPLKSDITINIPNIGNMKISKERIMDNLEYKCE